MKIVGNRKRPKEKAPPIIFRPRAVSAGNRRRVEKPERPKSSEPAVDAGDGVKPRPLRFVAKLVVAIAATGLSLLGGAAAYEQATSADYFAVTDIHVSGNVRLSETEIVRASGIERGVNVFRLDPESVVRSLKSEPWILEARAMKKLPRGLEISVVERKLEALVLFDVLYLVDDSGALFKRWAPGDPIASPVITGLSREKLSADASAVQATLDDAIALARRYRELDLEKVAPLSEVHAELDGGFSLTVGAEPFYVRFGKGPYRQKLERLATLVRKIRADGEKPEIVYFDNEIRPDRVTVKLKGKPAEEEQTGFAFNRAP